MLLLLLLRFCCCCCARAAAHLATHAMGQYTYFSLLYRYVGALASQVARPILQSRTTGPSQAHCSMPPPSSNGAAPNRPKNHLITDATKPFTFRLLKYGREKRVTVDQTAEEATWPGGALWDVGVLMAKLLVMATSPPPPPNSREPFIPRLVAPGVWGPVSWRERRVLELGCGVGLSGLVAAAVGARAVLLTDLQVVIDGITQRNVQHNSRHLGGNGGAKISAMSLCWGNADDEAAAAQELDRLAPPLLHDEKGSGAGGRKKKKKSKARKGVAASDALPPSSSPISREGMPDIVLIGDVAYQHKPGSFSHFEALMSTVLRFTDEHTLVLFGTRCRMPASADLLEMFRLHFHEVIEPILAHEISDAFSYEKLGRRHNISIHLLRRKKERETSVNAAEVSEVE